MTRLLLKLFILFAAITPGCQENPAAQPQSPSRPRPNLEKWQAAFKRAEKIELFSILPISPRKFDLPNSDILGKYPVVGSATITDEAEKDKIYRLLKFFIYDHHPDARDISLSCIFSPHHALTITENGATHKIIICFTCGEVRTWSSVLPYQDVKFLGTDEKEEKEIDAILKAHGIELGKDYKMRIAKEEREKKSMP